MTTNLAYDAVVASKAAGMLRLPAPAHVRHSMDDYTTLVFTFEDGTELYHSLKTGSCFYSKAMEGTPAFALAAQRHLASQDDQLEAMFAEL